MAVPYTPHTITVTAKVETVDNTSKVVQLQQASMVAEEVTGLMRAKDTDTVYQRWGMVLTAPYEFFGNPGDEDKFKPGCEVTWNDLTFVVEAPVKVNIVGLPADHFVVLLKQLQYAGG